MISAKHRLLTTSLRAGSEIDDEVAVVVSTSGTTGTPKGALLTVSALTASAEATHDRLGGAGQWLLALPAHHVAGLQVLVRSVVAGTTPVAISASFSAAELVSAVDSLGSGRRYVSLVSAQLDKSLSDPAAAAALASLDAVLIGGGPMPAGVAERASAAGVPVVRTYGMSETAGGCVYDGRPLGGVRVRVDDGRVVLGGATLAKGYRNPVDPDPFAEPGWFRTDDVGTVDDSGVLTIHGRVDDAHQHRRADGVAVDGRGGGGITRRGGRVCGVRCPRRAPWSAGRRGHCGDSRVSTAPTLADIRAHVAERLDVSAAPREMHVVDEIPRRGIGKVDRRALVARFGG